MPKATHPTAASDKLTALLPVFLHHPVRQLVLGVGFDPPSAIVAVLTAVACWAGRGLKVRTVGGVDIRCMISTVVGLPVGVSPDKIEAIIVDGLAREEEGLVAGNKGSGFHVLPQDSRSRESRRTLVRNGSAQTIRSVCQLTNSKNLMLTLVGEWWSNIVLKAPNGKVWEMRNGLHGAFSRTCGQHGTKLEADFSGPADFDVMFWAAASAHNVERLAREDNYIARSVLYNAICFSTTRRDPTAACPDLRDDAEEQWKALLARASKMRAGDPAVIVPEPALADKFESWRAAVVADIKTLPDDDAMQLTGLFDLPARIYGTLKFVDPYAAAPEKLAFELAYFLRQKMVAERFKTFAARERDARLAHKTRLLDKITAMGPVSFRRLLRTEHYQKWDFHAPVLRELVNENLLEVNANHHLVAVTSQFGLK